MKEPEPVIDLMAALEKSVKDARAANREAREQRESEQVAIVGTSVEFLSAVRRLHARHLATCVPCRSGAPCAIAKQRQEALDALA